MRAQQTYAATCIQCGKVWQARGYAQSVLKCCSPACASRRRSEAHYPATLHACIICSVRFQKGRSGCAGLCCSRPCGYAWQAWQGLLSRQETARREQEERLHATRPCVVCGAQTVRRGCTCSDACRAQRAKAVSGAWYRTWKETKRPEERERQRRIRAARPTRACPECETSFVPIHARRKFCSNRCTTKNLRRIEKRLRRARKRMVPCETVDPIIVFKRDGWTCQLCGCATPRKQQGRMVSNAPELDHIVPLSRGGSHTYLNVQCACRRCNGEKGAHIRGQMRLCG